MFSLRVLPLETAPGAALMAGDESLLQSAASGAASLRFYQWAEPTLSLGYFQPASERFDVPGLAALPWLRRASGGAALVHHRELTYALALPPGRPWQEPHPLPWTCRMHELIAGVLRDGWGVRAARVPCGAERKLGPVLCFLDQTRGDLLCEGHKVVGSAQRKGRGAVLQHGGILLARSEHAPQLPGVRELAGADVDAGDLARRLAESLAAETGWRLEPGDWTDAEREAAARFERERYAAEEWNAKR